MEARKETEIYNQGYRNGYNDGENAYIDPDYWTRLEHQAAIAAMQGMCANHSWDNCTWDVIANDAYEAAHALVEKIKENEKTMH